MPRPASYQQVKAGAQQNLVSTVSHERRFVHSVHGLMLCHVTRRHVADSRPHCCAPRECWVPVPANGFAPFPLRACTLHHEHRLAPIPQTLCRSGSCHGPVTTLWQLVVLSQQPPVSRCSINTQPARNKQRVSHVVALFQGGANSKDQPTCAHLGASSPAPASLMSSSASSSSDLR